jgi:hypothetical protein
VRKISERAAESPVRPNGKASLSDGFCWLSCREAAGAALPLTGCNEVIYLPNCAGGAQGRTRSPLTAVGRLLLVIHPCWF